MLVLPVSVSWAADADVQELQQELKALRAKITELETVRDKLKDVEDKLSTIQKARGEAGGTAPTGTKKAQTKAATERAALEKAYLAKKIAYRQKQIDENSSFQFHGYLRAGAGQSSEGGNQVCFKDPGAPVKYRLGNECEDYAELAFDKRVLGSGSPNQGEKETGQYFDVKTRLAFDAGFNQSSQKADLYFQSCMWKGGIGLEAGWKGPGTGSESDSIVENTLSSMTSTFGTRLVQEEVSNKSGLDQASWRSIISVQRM